MKIVMLGTALDTKGGISSVVNVYKSDGLFRRWPITYIVTHCDGSGLKKILAAVRGLIFYNIALYRSEVLAVHAHVSSRASFWRKSIFIACAFLFRVPVIFHLHGAEFQLFYKDECSSFRQFLIRSLLNRCYCLIALSPQWQAWLKPLVSRPSVLSIYNPVQILNDDISKEPRKTLLFLGRLGKRKGIYDVIEALVKVKQRHSDVLLIAAGDGEREEVERFAKLMGVRENIEIPGWIDQKQARKLRRKSWIYVMPSYNEGLPMSILEAMSSGLPVISTPVGGIPDAVSDGVEGLLIEPGNVEQLAESIVRLLEDNALRRQMGLAAEEKIRNTFSTESTVPQIEAIYQEIGCLRQNGFDSTDVG